MKEGCLFVCFVCQFEISKLGCPHYALGTIGKSLISNSALRWFGNAIEYQTIFVKENSTKLKLNILGNWGK
jgi:hypothetical protein